MSGLHYGVWIVQEAGYGRPGMNHVNDFPSVLVSSITMKII